MTIARILWLPLLLASAGAACGSGALYYGSRAGMVVSVVSVSGLDTAHAIVRTRHTRANAIEYCRDYVLKVDAQCISEELAKPLNDEVDANCTTGVFSDFFGKQYQFKGGNAAANAATKYLIADLPSNQIEDGSESSGYPTNIAIFQALCPNEAPLKDE